MFQLDPSRSNSSTISVLSLPDRLTVEWSNVSVMADAEHPAGGAFTFQVQDEDWSWSSSDNPRHEYWLTLNVPGDAEAQW